MNKIRDNFPFTSVITEQYYFLYARRVESIKQFIFNVSQIAKVVQLCSTRSAVVSLFLYANEIEEDGYSFARESYVTRLITTSLAVKLIGS